MNKTDIQLIWGIALVAAGIGVLFRIPQVMPQIKQIEYFASIIYFVYFCFYVMAILLIGGGAKKIFTYLKGSKLNNGG